MGFCTDAQYQEFMQSCPEFERMLVRSGIVLIKYWFSVSDAEQERRFQDRMDKPTKRWKAQPMDLESRKHWAEYSRAKDDMFAITDTKQVPWLGRSTPKTRRPPGSTSSTTCSRMGSLSRSDARAAGAAKAGKVEVRPPAHPGARTSFPRFNK